MAKPKKDGTKKPGTGKKQPVKKLTPADMLKLGNDELQQAWERGECVECAPDESEK